MSNKYQMKHENHAECVFVSANRRGVRRGNNNNNNLYLDVGCKKETRKDKQQQEKMQRLGEYYCW